MRKTDLDALERDTEQARARFASDLARLRSPGTFSRFKDDVWTEVIETKDALVDKTTGAAKDGAQRILADLKERAVANPAAAVAIGAGLAWRLVHRPPIATLLVGMGLIGLLRTSPSQASSPRNGGSADDHSHLQHRNDNDASLAEQTAKIADVAKQKVQDWSVQTNDTARETATQIADKAALVADRASDALRDAGDVARDSFKHVADKAASVASQASRGLHAAIPDRADRNTYLLGAAALAVTAAVGVAYQRRAEEDSLSPWR